MGLAIELLNKLATLRETNLEDDLDNMFADNSLLLRGALLRKRGD